MRRASGIIALLAGLLLLDLLLNAAGVDPRAIVVSLLRPSIDLLVVGALLLGAAQAGAGGPGKSGGSETSHRIIRGIVCLFVVGVALHTLARRFGGGGTLSGVGWALVVVGAAAVAVIGWFAGGLVTRGFSTVLARSIFLLVLALLAVIHVLAGNHVFAPSEIPRIIRDAAALFHKG